MNPVQKFTQAVPSNQVSNGKVGPQITGLDLVNILAPLDAVRLSKNPPAKPQYPIVIVGGGLSGMTAAYLAQKMGIQTLVLESAKRLGGNAKTGYTITQNGKKLAFPVGASVLAVANETQRQLFKELGIDVSNPKYKIHTDIAYFNGEWISIDPQQPQKSSWANTFVQGTNQFIDTLRRILKPTSDSKIFPLREMDPSVFEWDKFNMGTFLRQYPEKVHQFFETNLRSDIAVDMKNLSALAGIIDQGADQGERVLLPGGNYYLIRQMRQQIEKNGNHVQIQSDSPVVGIEDDAEMAKIHFKTSDGSIQTVTAKHVLLAMPSHQIPQLMKLPTPMAEWMTNIKRGAYAMLNLYLNESPVQSNTYYKFPYAKWIADIVQNNEAEDPDLKPGSKVPSVLTGYVGIPSEMKDKVPSQKQLAREIIDETSKAWPWLKSKIQGSRLTYYPDAMSAPAPYQMTQIRDFDRHVSPHVRTIHSDFSGVFAARGAIDEAYTAMQEIQAEMGLSEKTILSAE